MLYKTVEIRLNLPPKKGWSLSYRGHDGMDRIKGRSCKPNSMGFFHYWEIIPDEVAAQKLKSLLLKDMELEIKRLEELRSYLLILEVKPPKTKKKRKVSCK